MENDCYESTYREFLEQPDSLDSLSIEPKLFLSGQYDTLFLLSPLLLFALFRGCGHVFGTPETGSVCKSRWDGMKSKERIFIPKRENPGMIGIAELGEGGSMSKKGEMRTEGHGGECGSSESST